MNKALAFARLDYFTVKPYLTIKNLFILISIVLIMVIGNNNAGAAIGMLMAFAVLYSGYPFVVGDKSNIDVLYVTLSIKRGTVVLGRYLFALTLDLCSGLLAYALSFILLAIMQKSFDFRENLYTILVLFLLFSTVQALQFPIYFKLGYAKAKLLANLPIVVLPLAVVLLSNTFKAVFSLGQIADMFEWFAANLSAIALVGGIVWLAIIAVSYKLSLSFYGKRDF